MRSFVAKYSVIIPAHNEEERIAPTLLDLASHFTDSEIIVVLNGCTDGTEAVVKTVQAKYLNIRLIVVARAIGKGGAIRTGFLMATAPVVAFVDADGATGAAELRRLCDSLGDNDGVIGSRWLPSSIVHIRQPLKRRIASRVFNGLVQVMFGLPYRDTQCGAKVFRASAVAETLRHVETSNLAFDVDLLFQMRVSGKKVAEKPTEWRDCLGSKVPLARSSLRMLGAIARLRIRHSFWRLLVPLFDVFFPTHPLPAHDRLSILILNWRDVRHPRAGGAETYLHEMAKNWARRGHYVAWATSRFPGSARTETIDGVRVYRAGNRFTVYALLPLLYLRQFRDRFDVIVDAENGIPFFSPLFSLKPKLLLMFHVHRRVFQSQLPRYISWFFVWLETWLMPRLYRNARTVTISESTRNEMIELGMARGEVPIVHSGVDPFCAPGQKSQEPTIAYVGRVERYKRLDLLIEAFRFVLADVPRAQLIIAGSGADRERLEAHGLDLLRGGNLRFLGHVSDAEKRTILRSSWCFVSPSSMEGWGIAAIEANASGTPAIAFDVPGLREAIQHAKSGLIVPDGDLMALALAIRGLLMSRKRREALSLGAIAHARQFSWDATAGQFLDEIMRAVPVQDLNLMRIEERWRIVTRGGSEAEEIVAI